MNTIKLQKSYHTYNPYKHLTREEIMEQLAIARKNAEKGHVMEARQASDNIREKYGLDVDCLCGGK